MNRICVAGLLCIAASSSAFAANGNIYAGAQMDNSSASALLGFQANQSYTIEAHYTESDSRVSHSAITSDTHISAFGVAALAMYPLKRSGGTPYFLFGKAGYERISKEETYSIPSSVTLTLPYNDKIKSFENRVIVGGGVQFDFYSNLIGRVGIDFTGDKRSVYVGAIIRY